MGMAQISIRIDDTVKDDADKLFAELGLTLSGAFNIFIRQAIRQRGIPFVITAESSLKESGDPFYNAVNMRRIEQSIQQIREGRIISKSFEELEQMAK
jgi:DNA-damage-inducible protein J